MSALIWRLLGKGPEVAVVTFCTGPADLCRRMADEVRELVPGRRHFFVTEDNWPQVRRELKPYRIGLVPVLLGPTHRALRRAAFRLAPHKILAYNSRLERHHLRPDLPSLLFLRERLFTRRDPLDDPEHSGDLEGPTDNVSRSQLQAECLSQAMCPLVRIKHHAEHR